MDTACSLSLCLLECRLREGGCEPGGQRSWHVERKKTVTMAQRPVLLSLSSAYLSTGEGGQGQVRAGCSTFPLTSWAPEPAGRWVDSIGKSCRKLGQGQHRSELREGGKEGGADGTA